MDESVSGSSKLGDLGERAILERIFTPRYSQTVDNYGDDCASFDVRNAVRLIATTDPCPTPAASILGYDDYYYWGWLLATINLSDLAAAGATPVGLLSSLILPNEMTVFELERILDGIDECCHSVGARVLGGNIKEGSTISLSATALGTADGSPMSRQGAEVGDLLVVIGDLGLFWAGYLASTSGLSLGGDRRAKLLRNLLKPTPLVAVGGMLRREGLVKACLDNSDGLYPSLLALSKINDVRLFVDFDSFSLSEEVQSTAEALDVAAARLCLGWGDWNLLVVTSQENADSIRNICAEAGVLATFIGDVRRGSGVYAAFGEDTGELMKLDSQRFSKDSWFTAGIESYIEKMLEDPIVDVKRPGR